MAGGIRVFAVAIAALSAARVPALAQEDELWHPPPDRLTIGYEGEGKVDASKAACEAFVRDMVQWSEAEIVIGTNEVCGARKRHLQAYEALQKSYATLREHLLVNRKLDAVQAVQSFEAMVKGCIEHKTSLSGGGHNIRSDIIPNDNAAICLKIGKDLLDAETEWFRVGFTVSHPAP